MKTDTERAPLILKRTQRGLEPTSKAAADLLSKYDIGSYVEVSVKQRRSPPQNAAYWADLARVVEATEAFPTAEALHNAIKMSLGYTTPVKNMAGEIVFVPDSTAFGKMDAPAFREFYARAERLIAEQLGIDLVELRTRGADVTKEAA